MRIPFPQSTLNTTRQVHFLLCLLFLVPGSELQSTLAQSTSLSSTSQRAPTSLLSASRRAPLKFFASTDPKKQNADYKMLAPGQTMRVPLIAGRLLRLWSTSSEPESLVLQLQNRGLTYKLLGNNLRSFGDWQHKAYTLYPTHTAFMATYDPARTPSLILGDLKPGATLIATNRAKVPAKWFYQVTVGEVRSVFPPRSSALEDAKQTEARFQIASNASQTLVPKSNTGCWTQIEIELPKGSLKDVLNAWRTLRLQAKYKDEDSLAIDVPLLALSGQFWRSDSVRSEAVEFDGQRKLLKWKLPIAFGADDKVAIFNGGTKKTEVVVRLWETLLPITSKANVLRLHGLFGSTRTKRGSPIPILSARGEGALVGLAMDIRPVSETTRRSFAYLEGNEIIVADGAKYEGTGTEDYFNSAWYFPDKPFVGAFGGLTFKNAQPPQSSMVRWMLPDAIPFRRSLDFTFEHGRANNSDDLEYRWVAFWYQQPGGEFTVEDALKYGTAVEQGQNKNVQRDAVMRRYILGTLVTMLVVGAIVALLSRRGKKLGD